MSVAAIHTHGMPIWIHKSSVRLELSWSHLRISAGVSGHCCHLGSSYRNRTKGLVPELSLIFCAIGLNDVQLSRLSTEVISAPRITKAYFR